MASEKGSIATEGPSITPSFPSTTFSSLQASGASATFGSEHLRIPSAKRGREISPTSPTTAIAAGELSPSKIARLVGYARQSPAPFTGAAALEDERRTREEAQRLHPPGISENPSLKVLSELKPPAPSMSPATARSLNAPAGTLADVEVAVTAVRALQPVIVPSIAPVAEMKDTSPRSTTSAASLSRAMDSPNAMEVDNRTDRQHVAQPGSYADDRTSMSLSYPGILPTGGLMSAPAPPSRGMSLPMSNVPNPDVAPRSPSSKKHKCPDCETEFTRHHNLKSHLLTHSHEKPFYCQDCQMRFRRLHDLKRHSKLHSGEKPHVCPKCERKFARGDALARHAKGAGGCAGRRTSMGSFAGDDDFDGTDADDSAMTGIVFDGNGEGDMTEEERRRLSLPSIRAQHVQGQTAAEGYAPYSRTYPPAGPRPSVGGGLYPPVVDRGSVSSNTSPSIPNSISSTKGHTPSTSISSMPMSAGASSLYSQSGITESPKPLSPGQGPHDKRTRSPSLAAQLQHHLGHRQSDHQVATRLTLPPHAPAPSSAVGPLTAAQHVNSRGTAGGANTFGKVDNTNNMFAAGESGLWAYVQALDEKVKRLTEETASLRRTEVQLTDRFANLERNEAALSSEVASLRQQIGARPNAPQPVPLQH